MKVRGAGVGDEVIPWMEQAWGECAKVDRVRLTLKKMVCLFMVTQLLSDRHQRSV